MTRFALFIILSASALCAGCSRRPVLVIAVCDPLARETASECVKPAAVREYDAFAERLSERAGVRVVLRYLPFDAQVSDAMKRDLCGAVIAKTWTVIGTYNHWVRLADMADAKGSTTLAGVFIVRADSSFRKIADLDGKRVLFGPKGAFEKSFLAEQALADANAAPSRVEVIDGCLPLAAALLEGRADAGVVSSYVADYGGLDLAGDAKRFREIGRTEAVPFMTFAVSPRLDAAIRERVAAALLEMTGQNVPQGLYSAGFTPPTPWIEKELKP